MYHINNDRDRQTAFNQAVESGAIQHLRGTIGFGNGDKIYFGDWSEDRHPVDIIGTPSYNKQCTSNTDVFGVGQLYTGTARVTLALEERRADELRGAELTMEFGIEGFDERIPLGRWTVSDPKRDSVSQVTISAVDCIAKLGVEITDKYVGVLPLAGRMAKVEELTGIEFAQTEQEITALMDYAGGIPRGSSYCKTCRDEITAIAQMIGGFAFANREGKLEFRRFGSDMVWQIRPEYRQNAKLSEYTYCVGGVAYVDQRGHRTTVSWESEDTANTTAAITLSGNPYIWERFDDYADEQYREFLAPIAFALQDLPKWVPGQIEYYGNPAFDIGDIISINDGINGENVRTLFLITTDSWQFRAPQTLISAGADNGSGSISSSGGVSSYQQVVNNVNLTKNIVSVPMEAYLGEVTDEPRTIADGAFSVRSQTTVFAYISAEILGSENSDVIMTWHCDGELQTMRATNTVSAGETRTVTSMLCITADQGARTVTAECSGNAEITHLTAYIWGQNITAEQPDYTGAEDYEYITENGITTITRYIGTSRKPSVPSWLGGAPVKIIASGAFMGTEVEWVYIPKGVEEIQ